jgi:hypothetical protein
MFRASGTHFGQNARDELEWNKTTRVPESSAFELVEAIRRDRVGSAFTLSFHVL